MAPEFGPLRSPWPPASPRKRRLAGWLLLIALLLLGAGIATALRDTREAPSPRIGRAAPAFALPRLDDAKQTLSSTDLRGQVWLLNLWASWCAPCRDEHPLLVTLARDHGVSIVGLLHQDDPRAAEEWLRRLGDPYRWTDVDREGQVGRAWGIDGVPQTWVIDRDGVVRLELRGPLTAAQWTREVQPLLQRMREDSR